MRLFTFPSLVILFFCLSFVSCPGFGQANATIESPTLTLNLRDAILMTLEHNQSLKVEQYSPEIYKTFVAEENAVFDSNFDAGTSFSESKGQRTSGVGEYRGVSSRRKSLDMGVTKQTTSGMTLGVDATATAQESNVYTRLYSTRLGTSLTMPFLKGRGSQVNLVGVRQAEMDTEISNYELQAYTQALISQVEELYWDLYSAREELKIQNASLALAKEQLKETKDRIEVGDMPEIELAAAEGEVALRQEEVINARSTSQTNTLQLIRLLNPSSNNRWSLAMNLVENPTMDQSFTQNVEDLVQIALQSRPDLNQARVERDKRDLTIVRTKNGLLPRLDFFITFGKTGYAGSFGDSVRSIDDDNYDLNTGFQFQYSFANRAQKARHERAQYQAEEAKAALTNMEQLIELDVRTAFVEVKRSIQQITATRAATQLQEAKYQAEVVKFRVGKSTNLLVLLAQRDLTRSRLDALRAQIQYRKALVQLDYAQGILLDKNQIVLPTNEGS